MQITFLGATGTVTGSKYLLTFNEKNILVDCGLFQGQKELRLRNWSALPFNPRILDAVILTHAHIDHTGYLPLLVKNGFNKPIYCTHGTKDLCDLLLPDSAHLQEEDAKHANEHHYSIHRPALPLYTVEDAEKALKLFQPQAYNSVINLLDTFSFQLIPARHIIGSSFVRIQHQDASLLFTGDLGRHSTSAHADYSEILAWLKQFNQPPQKTFITHGESEAALSLKHKIEAQLGWQCCIPEYGQKEQL